MVSEDDLKRFSCSFWDDVLCSYKKNEDEFAVLGRCHGCEHYKRFMREMEEEDERIMNEIDETLKNPEAYQRGELR